MDYYNDLVLCLFYSFNFYHAYIMVLHWHNKITILGQWSMVVTLG